MGHSDIHHCTKWIHTFTPNENQSLTADMTFKNSCWTWHLVDLCNFWLLVSHWPNSVNDVLNLPMNLVNNVYVLLSDATNTWTIRQYYNLLIWLHRLQIVQRCSHTDSWTFAFCARNCINFENLQLLLLSRVSAVRYRFVRSCVVRKKLAFSI